MVERAHITSVGSVWVAVERSSRRFEILMAILCRGANLKKDRTVKRDVSCPCVEIIYLALALYGLKYCAESAR